MAILAWKRGDDCAMRRVISAVLILVPLICGRIEAAYELDRSLRAAQANGGKKECRENRQADPQALADQESAYTEQGQLMHHATSGWVVDLFGASAKLELHYAGE